MPPEERRSNTIGPKKGSFKSGVITFSERVITSLCIRAHAYAGGTRERIMGSRAGRRSGRGREAATKRVVINAVGSPTLSLSHLSLGPASALSCAHVYTRRATCQNSARPALATFPPVGSIHSKKITSARCNGPAAIALRARASACAAPVRNERNSGAGRGPAEGGKGRPR
jgi:hypothetical protein